MSSRKWRPFCLGLNVWTQLRNKNILITLKQCSSYVFIKMRLLQSHVHSRLKIFNISSKYYKKISMKTYDLYCILVVVFAMFLRKLILYFLEVISTELSPVFSDRTILTLLVLSAEYPRIKRSIAWLLIPRILASPGHQQLWCWLWKISTTWCPFYLHRLSLIPTWISYYVPSVVWVKILIHSQIPTVISSHVI